MLPSLARLSVTTGAPVGLGERELVLAAVNQNGSALEYAPVELRGDKGVVLAAVKRSGTALRYASVELRGDRGVVLAALEQNGYALAYASVELKNDEEIVLAAVNEYFGSLQFASHALQGSHRFILAAMAKSGLALYFASADFRKDPEVVLTAVEQNGLAFKYASENLKNDPDVVLAAVEKHGQALQYASLALQNDPNVMLAAATAIHHPRFDLIEILTTQISNEIDAVLGSAVMVFALSAFRDEATTYDFEAVAVECKRLEKLGDDVVRLSTSVERMPDGDEKTKLGEMLEAPMKKLGGVDTNPCIRHEYEDEFVDQPDRSAAKRMRIAAALARLLPVSTGCLIGKV